MTVTKEAVVEKLRSIRGQNMESDIVSLGLVSEIFIADSKVFFSVTVPAETAREMEPLRAAAEAAVKSLPGVDGAVDGRRGGLRAPAPGGRETEEERDGPGRGRLHGQTPNRCAW